MGCLLPLLSLEQDHSAAVTQREMISFVPSGLLGWSLHPFSPESWQPPPSAKGDRPPFPHQPLEWCSFPLANTGLLQPQ